MRFFLSLLFMAVIVFVVVFITVKVGLWLVPPLGMLGVLLTVLSCIASIVAIMWFGDRRLDFAFVWLDMLDGKCDHEDCKH